ncbi:hypothetical protein [Caldibacillus debilis]|uniref:hypothetical protein n=1 Tax=Caldibacillus debilis TaxID=301148 RepID=UPI0011C3BA18|nr:hypothetical protein [Caldibacillus debilis]
MVLDTTSSARYSSDLWYLSKEDNEVGDDKENHGHGNGPGNSSVEGHNCADEKYNQDKGCMEKSLPEWS